MQAFSRVYTHLDKMQSEFENLLQWESARIQYAGASERVALAIRKLRDLTGESLETEMREYYEDDEEFEFALNLLFTGMCKITKI